MPTRKQRRRREKLQRHEWEYVIETEEGEVIPLESPRTKPEEAERDKRAKAHPKGPVDRRGRPIPKPSKQRVLKRTAIFGPLLFFLVWVTSPDLSTAAKIANVVILLAFFIPFSYLVDVLVYRMLMRRRARQRERG